jgi:hypothetical protein
VSEETVSLASQDNAEDRALSFWLLLQEVWYQLSFEGYPESDAEWFPASRIRSEHPQGDALIAAFDRGLEASGQGDVALPPHAAERAAALSVGTPQVGVFCRFAFASGEGGRCGWMSS